MKTTSEAELAIAAVAIVAAVYLYRKGKAELTQLTSTTLNPTSDQNAAYTGANAVLQSVTGDSTDTLGTWLYGLFNPSAANYDPNAGLPASTAPYTGTPYTDIPSHDSTQFPATLDNINSILNGNSNTVPFAGQA